ncbi:hypothetical protein A5772_20425 [Mycolicibacter sinensis]|uniref:Uncharacterized protein n=1 Tax=Mycolicibacter sinensis (strain JDM601) TaxID=875328 RepID=A0A1A2EQC2_MYCSD|nr:hypothetical protein A5771_08705 [Mycolicibacter sinensis]OBG07041.1 hypothetical protein A5772_20425 [Mycolicibacter sinensis]
MRVVQCTTYRADNLSDLSYWHTGGVALLKQVAGIDAWDILHRDPQLALVFTTIAYTDDVGVPQAGRQISFTTEPLPVFGIRRDIGW